MGIGPFAYMPFILAILKFNDAAYDTRLSVHKLMGVLTFIYILVNQLMGGSILIFDVIMFLFAGFFFYRAMSDDMDRVSVPGIAVIAVFGLLFAYVAWPEPPSKEAQASNHPGASNESSSEKELKKALETAQRAMSGQGLPAELTK